jgi:hypothetical protein
MKAEHRKELQTNALADRMGRVIKRMKQRPSRGSFMTVVLVILVVVAVIFFLWRRGAAKEREAQRWVDFARGQDERLLTTYPGTTQAHLAEIQLAWFALYESGIKRLPVDPKSATQSIQAAKTSYERIWSEMKDDPVIAPEARYAIAVAEESLAVDDPVTHLEAARKLYDAVVADYPNSAHAEEARKRAKLLADPEQRARIERFYNALGRSIGSQNQIFSPQRLDEILKKMKQKEK